ncbi:hypothetical protein BOTBODRAFT_107233 [Botryobasidium botryosum FD-172 SS1]|uniref:non-specific serine/threonine protein kinase n=1 Tax=Botryobasidium botryosum (strain FD-172 SS1) TaxID=930990 RepID=A0A067ML10_BOTB1|nr:hypothetical protein BOTBODRAFT_107233 [Botryobasidium botryosum FD-172 SS1]
MHAWPRRILSSLPHLNILKPAPTVAPEAPILLPHDVPIQEERKDDYDPKHYYPVQIGEVLHGTYKIVTKIGYGGSSTVWLARNMNRWNWQKDRYAALKICNNDYADKASAEHELNISRHIATANPSHPGFKYVRTVRDAFSVQGPHGTHMCLVYEPMREPIWLLQRRFANGRFSTDMLKATLECVLLGLDYLHTECHVVHTDLKPGNILLGVENISVLDQVAQDEALDPSPRKAYDDRVVYLSRNDFGHPKRSPREPKIADFDAAVRGDGKQPLRHPIQPNLYRAPEVTLGAAWTYSADIWNLGMMLWDLLEAKPLCCGIDPRRNEYTSHAQLAELIGLLGPPPMELLDRGKVTAIHFEPNGKLCTIKFHISTHQRFLASTGEFQTKDLIPEGRTLANSVTTLHGEDKQRFLEFAGSMLQWLPENRATTKELLDDPWLHHFVEGR